MKKSRQMATRFLKKEKELPTNLKDDIYYILDELEKKRIHSADEQPTLNCDLPLENEY